MRHMNYKGRALCNAVKHSMNLADDWKDVTCKRCLSSSKKKWV